MITFWRSNSSSDPGGRSNALKVAPHLDKVEAAASRFSCVARSASDQRGVRHKPMRGFPEAETEAGRPDVACKPSERSSTVRAKSPIVSSDSATNLRPARLMEPKLGLIAATPQ